jgi:hypothetical protein
MKVTNNPRHMQDTDKGYKINSEHDSDCAPLDFNTLQYRGWFSRWRKFGFWVSYICLWCSPVRTWELQMYNDSEGCWCSRIQYATLFERETRHKLQLQGKIVSYLVKCQTFKCHVTRKPKRRWERRTVPIMSFLATCNFGSALLRSINPTGKYTFYLLVLANYFIHWLQRKG